MNSRFDVDGRSRPAPSGVARGALTVSAMAAVVVFPWPLAALLALTAAWYEPLVPFAAGIFADALYYTAHAARLPWFTVLGALASVLAVFVRSRLRAGLRS